jgi:hypothetical protein
MKVKYQFEISPQELIELIDLAKAFLRALEKE